MMSYAGVDLPVIDPKVAAWVEKNISPAFAYEFDPSYHEAQLECLPIPPVNEVPPVRPGVLYWPTGASRWGVFHTLLTGDQLEELRTALSTASQYATGLLVLDDGRLDSEGNPVGRVETLLTMIPPKPLSGQFPELAEGEETDIGADNYRELNKLWLVTLVDERFWWWFKQPELGELNPHIEIPGTWYDYFNLIFDALDLSPTPAIPINVEFYPKPKSRWHLFHRPLPPVFDAAATATGLKVVRKLNGDVVLQSWSDALTQARDDLMPRQYAAADEVTGQQDLGDTDMGRIAGGLIDFEDLRRSVPAAVRVVWSDKSSATYYEHTLASIALAEYLSFTGRADEIAVVRIDDLNGPESTDTSDDPSIWVQAAIDWYGWRLCNWDVTFGGVAQWDGCGWQDAVYWSQGPTGMFTRVTKPPVINGAGRGMCGDASGPLFFAKITGNDGGQLYSAVEVELHPTNPDTWEVKPGGITIGEWFGHRAPSATQTPPIIPNDQVVLAKPSVRKPGHFLLTPWGGQIRVFEKDLIQVCVRCIEQMDGTFKLRTRSVFRHWRRDARDHKRTLGLATDPVTVDPCTDC
jgi:hypothetical protein